MTAQQKMQTLLEGLKLPRKDIHVFGNCIHITCVGRDTAEKWNAILAKFCSNTKIVDTIFKNEVNKNTNLLPSSHKGFLIGGTI